MSDFAIPQLPTRWDRLGLDEKASRPHRFESGEESIGAFARVADELFALDSPFATLSTVEFAFLGECGCPASLRCRAMAASIDG